MSKKQIVYALFDNEMGEMHMFSTNADVLAKDAVMAFIEEHVTKDWKDVVLVEHKKDIQTKVSATKSPTDLVQTLVGYGFILNMLAV